MTYKNQHKYNSALGTKRKSPVRGDVAPNPLRPSLGKRTKIKTQFLKAGVNPQNTKKNTLNANRVQNAKGKKDNPVNNYNNPTLKRSLPRGVNQLSKAPFKGYLLLNNRKSMGKPFKASIRGQGNPVKRKDVLRLRNVHNMDLPDNALTRPIGSGQRRGNGFKDFTNTLNNLF